MRSGRAWNRPGNPAGLETPHSDNLVLAEFQAVISIIIRLHLYIYDTIVSMPKAMPTHALPLQGLFPIAKPSGPPS